MACKGDKRGSQHARQHACNAVCKNAKMKIRVETILGGDSYMRRSRIYPKASYFASNQDIMTYNLTLIYDKLNTADYKRNPQGKAKNIKLAQIQ